MSTELSTTCSVSAMSTRISMIDRQRPGDGAGIGGWDGGVGGGGCRGTRVSTLLRSIRPWKPPNP